MGEKEELGIKIGILGRKRILTEFSRRKTQQAQQTPIQQVNPPVFSSRATAWICNFEVFQNRTMKPCR